MSRSLSKDFGSSSRCREAFPKISEAPRGVAKPFQRFRKLLAVSRSLSEDFGSLSRCREAFPKISEASRGVAKSFPDLSGCFFVLGTITGNRCRALGEAPWPRRLSGGGEGIPLGVFPDGDQQRDHLRIVGGARGDPVSPEEKVVNPLLRLADDWIV